MELYDEKGEMNLRSEAVDEKTCIVEPTCEPTVGLVIIPDPFLPLGFVTFELNRFCPCGWNNCDTNLC